MTIQIDSREKARAIQKILAAFDGAGVRHFISKLYVGDYMNMDNPRIIIDRKQNLTELCANVCQNHDRFRKELIRARDAGIQMIILCEHGKDIKQLEDVIFWNNPRGTKRVKTAHGWETQKTKAMTGETLYKILETMSRKYNVQFLFCDKDHTGQRIMELLND